ncbi:Basic 7S globulin [Bienertia sinuspersici]
MASSFYHLLFIFTLLISTTFAATTTRPKALFFTVSKDSSTLQYVVPITQRTPPKPVPTTLHLGGPFVWVDCDRAYVSSTYRPAQCNSASCTLANSISCGTCNAPPGPGCNNNTCGLSPENPITNTATIGELASDLVRVNSTNGSNPGPIIKVPNFLFSCGPTFLLKCLAKGVQGVIGLGRTKISPVSQFSSTFSFPKRFAICLASFTSDNGVIFFGDAPFQFYPPTDLNSLKYTPLITNPTAPTEYFVGVTAIKIDNITVPINKSLLSINKKGNGGTKLSTVNPYTLMETSIYKAVTTSFDSRLKQRFPQAKRVKAAAPFEVCYDSNTLTYTRVGVVVPDIQLVLQNDNVVWTMYSSNSMVTVDNARCLALVDGGKNPKTSIVMGGYQLEDNFMQFDLPKSRLGFRYLVYDMTRCSNFNFTSVA